MRMQAGRVITIVVLLGLPGASALGLAQQAAAPPNAPTSLSFADLRPGQRVKVEGRMADDGSFIARRISLRKAKGYAEIEGRATLVDARSRSLRLLGFDVRLRPDADLPDGTTIADLANGQWLEVRGLWHEGRLEASRVRLRRPEPTRAEPEIEGDIERVVVTLRELALLGRRITSGTRLVVRDQREGQTATTPDRLRRDDGELSTSGFRIGNRLVLGGRFDGSVRARDNFDLNDTRADREGRIASGGRLDLSWAVHERLEVFARSSVGRDYSTRGGDWSGSSDLRVREAYLLMRDVGGGPLDLRVGRQRIRDARGWLLDEYMDAVRVHVDLAPWRFEGAVARALFAGPADDRSRRDALHVIASATRRLPRSTRITGYFIRRYDHARDEQPLWLGLMASGRVTADWRYWSSVAARRGRDGTTALRGWATEIGSTYQFDVTAAPTLTLRYAAGSGDRARQDGVDGAFRQTDLHSNRGKFDGFRWFDYYGEAFSPELSNITILTAAVGTMPARSLSANAVYHRFLRRSPDRALSSFRPDADLVRGEPSLGQELDAVVAWRGFGNTEISLTAGVFFPGAAFGHRATPAFVWEPRIRVYF